MAAPAEVTRGGISSGGWYPVVWGCLAAAIVAAVVLGGGSLPRILATRRMERAVARYDWPAALDALDVVEAGRPVSPEKRFLRGRILRRQGDLLAAEGCFATALAAGFDPAAVRRQRLLAVAQSGDVAVVADDILRLAEAGVDDELAEECYEAMIEGYVKAFRLREATQAIDLWLRWQPEHPLPFYWRGIVFETAEKWGDARTAYATALGHAPWFRRARRALARMERETGRLPEGAALFEACLAEQPDDATAVLGLGAIRLLQGDRQTAAALFTRALGLPLGREQRVEPLSELAQMALEDGAADRALELIDEALPLDPRSARCRRNRAAGLARLGRDAEAEQEQARAAELSEAQLEITRLIRDALSHPSDPDRRVATGQYLVEQGLDAEGGRWFELALQIEPRHAAAHQALADLWDRRGAPQRAAVHRAALAPPDEPAEAVP